MQPTYDVVLENGKVLDGSGGFIYQMDVGIKGNRVIATGKIDGSSTQYLIDVSEKLIVPWIPSKYDPTLMTQKKIETHYQNELDKLLKEDGQTVENAIRMLFTKKTIGRENGLGLIGKNFPAHLLVLNLHQVKKYAPLITIPKNALSVDYVIYNGTILP